MTLYTLRSTMVRFLGHPKSHDDHYGSESAFGRYRKHIDHEKTLA